MALWWTSLILVTLTTALPTNKDKADQEVPATTTAKPCPLGNTGCILHHLQLRGLIRIPVRRPVRLSPDLPLPKDHGQGVLPALAKVNKGRNFRSRGRIVPARDNSKYNPDCWTNDPSDQAPPIEDHVSEFDRTFFVRRRSLRRHMQIRRSGQRPCLWEQSWPSIDGF